MQRNNKYNNYEHNNLCLLYTLLMPSKFGFLSYEISHIIRQRFNKEAENIGLSHAQWRTLVHLSDNENCRQIDLAKILEIRPITLARQIDLLEYAGLIRRNKDSEDRRAYRLEIMPKTNAVMQELWDIADAVEAKVLSVLTAEEQELLIMLLERIKTCINNISIPEDSTLDD
jgi:MarR family transcriptional regulator for hemolysin